MRSKAGSVSESPASMRPPVHASGLTGHRAPGPPDPSEAIAAPHVLIADGNDESRSVRESQLRAAGIRVSVARTGFEAIVKASCHVPDLILLDDSLKDIEPAETTRLLKTCPVTAHIAIVRLPHRRRLPRRLLSAVSRGL